MRYSARANGRRVRGYVTTFDQLMRKLKEYFGKRSYDLYHVSKRQLKTITGEERLRRAMSRIPDGGTLLVKAYERY